MAHGFYGYGRWDAPYWFIGPEQGKGRKETSDNTSRLEAWVKLGKPSLCDCKHFHDEINETSWHGEKPALQRTWRPLILLLKTLLDESSDKESLRIYQRDLWGRRADGETCVIELCGLAAKSSKVVMEREQFRQERIETICRKLTEQKPKLVVMYGIAEKKYWEEIAGCSLRPGEPAKREKTTYAFTPHPNTHGLKDSYWKELGEKLHKCS